MRSTILFGNETLTLIHGNKSASANCTYDNNIFLVTSPLPSILSQDKIVTGPLFCSFLSFKACVKSPKIVFGAFGLSRSWIICGLSKLNSPVASLKLYPPSVIVSVIIFTSGFAIFSITAKGFSGAYKYSTIEPITRFVKVPSSSFTTSVYRPSCVCNVL